MFLFAQIESVGWRDYLIVIGPIFGGAVVWVVAELRKGRQQKRADRIEDERTAIEYYKDVIVRLQQQHAACEERQDRQGERLSTLEVKYGRLEVYTEGLEEKCEQNGIKFRKWRDTPAQVPPSDEPPPGPVSKK